MKKAGETSGADAAQRSKESVGNEKIEERGKGKFKYLREKGKRARNEERQREKERRKRGG